MIAEELATRPLTGQEVVAAILRTHEFITEQQELAQKQGDPPYQNEVRKIIKDTLRILTYELGHPVKE